MLSINPQLKANAMPTANDFFPSSYIRVADLNGEERIVTIDRVTSASFENDGKHQNKPVIHFRDDGVKPLVCNKTNFTTCAMLAGEDSDMWAGKKICLYPGMVDFKGKVQEVVRIKRVTAAATAKPAAIQADQEPSDEIPF
jgi:hypothetical protein